MLNIGSPPSIAPNAAPIVVPTLEPIAAPGTAPTPANREPIPAPATPPITPPMPPDSKALLTLSASIRCRPVMPILWLGLAPGKNPWPISPNIILVNAGPIAAPPTVCKPLPAPTIALPALLNAPTLSGIGPIGALWCRTPVVGILPADLSAALAVAAPIESPSFLLASSFIPDIITSATPGAK